MFVATVVASGYLAWPRLPDVESTQAPVVPTAVPTVDDPLLISPDRNGWIRQDGLEVRLLPGLMPTSCRPGRIGAECVRYVDDNAGVSATIVLLKERVASDVVSQRAVAAVDGLLGPGASEVGQRTDLHFGRAWATEIITTDAPGGESRTITVGRGRWLVVMTVSPGGDVDAYTRYRASIHID